MSGPEVCEFLHSGARNGGVFIVQVNKPQIEPNQ